ncbi:MAG: alpha-L-fucosidase [Bacteroidaceae bacterium]
MKICKVVLSLSLLFVGVQLSVAQIDNLPMTKGKFEPTDESLQQYQYPEWFRDAKFGIWAHWGPQSVPRQGDWYARNMYIQDKYDSKTKQYTGVSDADYIDHLKRYGHPSKFGYKDIIPLWKAQRFNPEKLMKLYKEVGARYFVSMGTHHDDFFLWNSKLNRWNAANMGPKRDIVGEWQKAAKKEGLPFGVSEHLAASYTWYQPAHSADKTGPMAGVPYDANDPKYADLYHGKAAPDDTGWLTNNPVWQREWYDRIKELIDMYHPDLLYSDSALPFGDVGRTLIAHYYNQDLQRNKKTSVVYTCKEKSNGRFVRDMERGVSEGISPYPWQTDTSIGDWFYRTGQKYKTSTQIIQMLVDIVSKNGNLLLNVVQTPEGDLEDDVIYILKDLAKWMKINGEAIYGTRPWCVYGEGPSTVKPQQKGTFVGLKDVRLYESTDLRFTTKNGKLYAFVMEHPTGDIHIKHITDTQIVKKVRLLGSKTLSDFRQNTDGSLIIVSPKTFPDYHVLVYEIEFKQ